MEIKTLSAVDVVIVAAGRGSRARTASSPNCPKQYADLNGRPVLSWTLDAFLAHTKIARVVTIIHPDDADLYQAALTAVTVRPTAGLPQIIEAVPGGASRQASVCAGLEALAAAHPNASAHPLPDRTVLIHDAARPFISRAVIDRVIEAISPTAGAIAALPVSDTLKRANPTGAIVETVSRDGLWRAQTPQGFPLAPLLALHRKARNTGEATFTDDAAIAEWGQLEMTLVEGESHNIKLTTAEDLIMAQFMAQSRTIENTRAEMETRVGSGFDVHKFGPGTSVWLCGIEIPHNQTLLGHSDADVGLHALTDAILGAIGDGDIGQHFPPSDPKWKGARSDQFLADAARRVSALGARIINVDVTLLCEEPKVGPHRPRMRQAIADILKIEVERVGVKATTTEGLGFTGRREGIASMASATISRPNTTVTVTD